MVPHDNTHRDVYYIDDMALRLGKSIEAVRQAVWRGDEWLPPHTKLGGRVVFKREEYEKWLASL